MIVVHEGAPVRLNFYRDETAACSEEIVFGDFGIARQLRVNPVYIPRNHLVEAALAAATGGNTGPLERLMNAVASPFDERPGLERYAAAAPESFGPYRTFCGT